MSVFKSELFANATTNDLENCAANHIFNFYKGKPTNGARFEAINRIREALKRLGYPTTDKAGEYGEDTARAVLAYKGPPRNILGQGQWTPDAVVGRLTIARLDEELCAKGLGGELLDPAPTPPDPPTSWWLYDLTTFSSYHIYILTIQRLDQLDYAFFKFKPNQIVTSISEISGSIRSNENLHPAFAMNGRIELSDFEGASCTINLQREGGMLKGNLSLRTTKGVSGRGEIPAYGQASNDGTWSLSGQLWGPIEWPTPSPAPSVKEAGHIIHAVQRD